MSPKPIPVDQRFWSKVEKTESCWIWIAAKRGTKKGKIAYGAIWTGGIKGTHSPAHRVSYEMAYGEIPKGLFVLHSCDNGLCVRPDHLFLGTHLDNSNDKVSKGRQAKGETHGMRKNPERAARGEKNHNSKLNTDSVIEIRRLRRDTTMSLNQIASLFSVSKKTILNVVHNRIWRHVK